MPEQLPPPSPDPLPSALPLTPDEKPSSSSRYTVENGLSFLIGILILWFSTMVVPMAFSYPLTSGFLSLGGIISAGIGILWPFSGFLILRHVVRDLSPKKTLPSPKTDIADSHRVISQTLGMFLVISGILLQYLILGTLLNMASCGGGLECFGIIFLIPIIIFFAPVSYLVLSLGFKRLVGEHRNRILLTADILIVSLSFLVFASGSPAVGDSIGVMKFFGVLLLIILGSFAISILFFRRLMPSDRQDQSSLTVKPGDIKLYSMSLGLLILFLVVFGCVLFLVSQVSFRSDFIHVEPREVPLLSPVQKRAVRSLNTPTPTPIVGFCIPTGQPAIEHEIITVKLQDGSRTYRSNLNFQPVVPNGNLDIISCVRSRIAASDITVYAQTGTLSQFTTAPFFPETSTSFIIPTKTTPLQDGSFVTQSVNGSYPAHSQIFVSIHLGSTTDYGFRFFVL